MENLLAARSQMAVSLAFHIVFAAIGVGLPFLMLLSEGLWLKTRRPVYLELTRAWAKGLAVFFAVGAVSGTVLSFELGLLWPEFELKSVWVALQSGSGAVRANALELLEAELHPDLRRLILPLFDGQVPTAERISKANELVGSEISHSEEAVRTWLASEDAWLKSCGVYAVGVLGLQSLSAEIATYAASPDPLLRETVRAAQQRLASVRAAPAEPEEVEEEADWTSHDSGSGMG